MGLFGKDWVKELERAEQLLQRDEPVAALERAERAERKGDADVKARATGLVLRARQAVLASVVARADAAEEAGDFADAADWLGSAIEREPSAVRGADLERRVDSLLQRAAEAEDRWNEAEASSPSMPVPELTVDHRYEALTVMLTDSVRELYEAQDEDFRAAVAALHAGEAGAALPVLESQAGERPGDAVVRLELGRARHFLGDDDGAVEDFAVAWRSLGDDPLQIDGSILPAALWAEAMVAAGRATEVVDRLEDTAASPDAHAQICHWYATALLAGGRARDAVDFLEGVVPYLPSDAELSLLLAQALHAAGDPDRARASLARVVDPTCTTGCAAGALHVPSLCLLARLHLLEGGEPERARELMAWAAKAQGGHLGPEEHAVLAAYYRVTGDREAADAAEREAARLADAG